MANNESCKVSQKTQVITVRFVTVISISLKKLVKKIFLYTPYLLMNCLGKIFIT